MIHLLSELRVHCPSLGLTIYQEFLFTGWLRVNMFESLLPPTTSWNMVCVFFCLKRLSLTSSISLGMMRHDTNHSEPNPEYLVVQRENKCTHTSLECDNPLLSLYVLGRRFPISRSVDSIHLFDVSSIFEPRNRHIQFKETKSSFHILILQVRVTKWNPKYQFKKRKGPRIPTY